MLQVRVRFSPEQVKAMPGGTFAALQQEIERRLTPQHPKLWLNVVGRRKDNPCRKRGYNR